MVASLTASMLTAALLQWVGGNVIPSGGIYLIDASACPSGSTEVNAFDGKFLRGTLNAHADIGGTGGSDTVSPTIAWPAGVPSFAGSSGTVPAETFTGSSATSSAVSAGTPAGTNGTVSFTPAGTNGTVSFTPAGTNAATATTGNCAATNVAIGTGATNACKATAPNLTVPAETFTGSAGTVSAQPFTGSAGTVPAEIFTGSALGTHMHTLTATGTNGTVSFTPAGTNAWPAGVPTNSSADNKPAFVKVIFCKKD